MAGTTIHPLRLPRVVSGLVGRSRNVERVAVWDEVPIAIPTRDAKDAPVILNDHHRMRPFRFHEGRLYAQLGERSKAPSQAWDTALKRNEAWIVKRVGADPLKEGDASAASHPGFGQFFPWTDGFTDASRRRGIVPAEAVRFREVLDPGTARRDAAALALGDRMLVLGSELWLRASLPRYQVNLEESVRWRFEAPSVSWREDADWGKPWDAGSFRVDRRRDGIAYAQKLSTECREFHRNAYREEMRIGDAGLLAECYDRLADEDTLAMLGIARGFSEAIRPHLGRMPVPEVARWVALQGLHGAADLQGMRDWLDGVPATREALAGSGMDRSKAYGLPDAIDLLDAAVLRYEAVERPRMNLGRDGDEAALLSL